MDNSGKLKEISSTSFYCIESPQQLLRIKSKSQFFSHEYTFFYKQHFYKQR